MTLTAKYVWADGPTSAPFEPQKPEIRAWGAWLENTLSVLGIAATAIYIRGTKAQLDAVVGQAGEVGVVVADDDPALRGIYVYFGSDWVKKLELPVDAAALILEQTEDARDLALDYRDEARDARDAAENYRDQAAAYVNDIASEKEVPIYGTVDGLTAIAIPVGVQTINVLGRSAMLDSAMSTWKRTAAEPDVAPKLKVRTTDRFLPNGTTSSSDGGWWQFVVSRPRVDQLTGAWSMQKSLDFLAARMAAGDTVKLACFGDSTTDGNQTTSWTANPVDGSGNAVGNSDHAATAPNAWPSVLQSILRAMHNNNNIHCYNAGYTGRRLTDGWAYANFEPAIINNPYYGVADAAIIGFGLNDQPVAGSQVQSMVDSMRPMALKAMAYGIVPVFLTCDAAPRTASSRDNREVSRQIDAAKSAVCAELDIPLIDSGAALDRWASRNADGFRWREQQTDYLHFQNAGHALKAGFIAKHFYRDTVEVSQGERRVIAPLSDESNSGHGGENVYEASNGRFAFNWTFARGLLSAGYRLIDAWVWCEDSVASALYRSVDGDVQTATASGLTDGNYVEMWSPSDGTRTFRPPQVGFGSPANGYRRSDMPSACGKLRWGLNRLSYRVGSALASGSGLGYCGWFDIIPSDVKGPRSALSSSGPFYYRQSAGSGLTVKFLPEQRSGDNLWGFSGTDAVELYADLVLPVGMGFVYGHCPGFGDAGQVDGDKSFSMIYRVSSTGIRLYYGRTINGVVSYPAHVASGTVGSSDAIRLRISTDRSGDDQVVSVYEGFTSTSPVMTSTIAYNGIPLVFGGAAGGFFANGSEITGTVSAELNSLVIQY